MTSSEEFRKVAAKQMWTDIYMGPKEATEFMKKDYEQLKATLIFAGHGEVITGTGGAAATENRDDRA